MSMTDRPKVMAGFKRSIFRKAWSLIPALLVMLFSTGVATSAFASSGATAIAAGKAHTVALKSDGTVVAWGDNTYQQTVVPEVSGVIAIAAGANHTVALKSDGSVVAWGDNTFQQTEVPAEVSSGVIAIAAGGNHTVALKSNGSVVAWGANSSVPSEISTGVIAISAGENHTVALMSNRSVLSWGDNTFQQTVVPPEASGVIAIAAGGNHTVALKSNGSVVEWGANSAVPQEVSAGVIAISAGGNHSVALMSNGKVVSWGDNTFQQTAVPLEALTGVVSIAAGNTHTVAMKSDGSVVAWGNNDNGQITVPELNSTGVKTIVARGQSVALKSDGSVVVWGEAHWSENVVPVTASSGVIAIAAGNMHTVALKSNGSVIAWGFETEDPRINAVPASALNEVKAISAAMYYTIALKSNGSVLAWGHNGWAQAEVPYSALSGVIAVSANYQHTLALKNNGSVVAWGGYNEYGQTMVPPSLSGVKAISAGMQHTVALKSDGSVVAWGRNNEGQTTVPPSLSGVKAISAGDVHTVALKSDGSVVGWGDNRYGQITVPPEASSGVIAIAAGSMFTIALKSDGSVVGWGQNDYGQTTGGYRKLTINPSGTPSAQTINISGSVGGLNCQWDGSATSGACSADIFLTTEVVLTASPADMIASISWGAGCDSVTATTCTINRLSADTTISPVISVKAQTIIFNPPAKKFLDDPAFDLSAYATGGDSGNPVTYTVTSGPGTLNGSILTITGLGNIVITASQAGDAIYYPAPDVQMTISVAKIIQSITFNPPTNKSIDDPAFDLSAYATGGASGNPVTFTVNSGPGVLNGNVLTITGVGNIIITASQAGNASYGLANVQRIITVFTSSTGVIAIAAGDGHTVALKSDGSVVAWGWNYYDQTTVPDSASSGVIAINAAWDNTVALKSDGSVVAWGNNYGGQTIVPTEALSGVIAIAAGSRHTVALKNDGSVVAWGDNSCGQTTVPASALSGVTAIAAGANHTVALKSDGSVVAWGWNDYGQTTVPDSASSGVIAINAGWDYTVALKSDGSVVAWGNNNFGYGEITVPVSASSGVVAIATTNSYEVWRTAALKSDGAVVEWSGWGGFYPVPDSASSGVVALATGSQHTVALKNDGSMVAWGQNNYGQTTVPNQNITFNPPTNMTCGDPALDLSAYASGGASGNPVTFTVASGPGTLDGSILTITGAGNIVITASQAGNGNYFPAPNVQESIIVAKAVATITLGSLSQTYDGTPKAASATTNPAGLAVTFTHDGSSTVPTNTGSYSVVATINDPNYQGTASGTLIISQAAATITLGNLSQSYDGTPKLITATTTPSGLAVAFTYNGNATAPTSVGDYAIVATINDPNYMGAAGGTLNIAKAAATITLGNLNQIYAGSPKSVSATTNPAGLAATFTYDGSATVPTNTGSYSVVATINDANYQGSASGTLTIAKANQMINFNPPANKTFGDPAFDLSVYAIGGASGNPVTFTVTSGPGTLNGSVLTITGAGNIVITASQAGNTNYYPAPDVQGTIAVAKKNQIINFNPPATALKKDTIDLSTYATGGGSVNPVTFTVSSGSGVIVGTNLSFPSTGIVVVTASQPGNNNYNAAADVQGTIVVTTH